MSMNDAMCSLALILLVASPIVAWRRKGGILCWVLLIAGEILAIIFAFPVVFSNFS